MVKNHIFGTFAIIIHACLKIFLHNLHIKVLMYSPINLTCIFRPILKYIALYSPSNLTVPSTSLSFNLFSAFFYTDFSLSDPKQPILVLSDHINLFQSSRVQSLLANTKYKQLLLCPIESKCFFCCTTAFISALFKPLLTVFDKCG